ncbi:MAG: alpha-glucosidase/alpha-galactosidase [Treponema sp.]|jgi:alpha-galactosidase|nr:alpha-glucosidase/alpha-galactosidase [Treponema sp.]
MNMITDNVKIAYIGGGSRNWAWVLMQDLCFEKDIGGLISLYDISPEDAKTNEIIGNRLMAAHNSRWRFQAVPSLMDALKDSVFVFVSILPGDFEEMSVDVHTPEKYGIWQPVGDTAGPGGLMRALRTIPQFRVIASAVREYAPDAWVVNYTNPMSICTRVLYKEFPQIKAFGCCHEVFNTQRLLAAVLEDAGLAKKDTIQREEIKIDVLGINHFTWFDRASWKNLDIFPYYKRFAEKYAETGFQGAGAATTFAAGSTGAPDADESERCKYFSSAERVKLDLFLRYGLIAAAGDRHLAEFCPHSWYLANPVQTESWGFALTPVSWRIRNREKLKQRAAAYRDGVETMMPVSSGEEGLKIVKALLGLGDVVTNVNLPNTNQMPGLPRGAIVETNAFFSRDNIQPILTKGLPVDLNALVLPHTLAQEGTVEAVFEHDAAKAFRVFSHDPSIQNISLRDAHSLFNEMCEKTLSKGIAGI